MITHDQKAYLDCRMDQIMQLLFDVVNEMEKWNTEIPAELDLETEVK